MTARGEFALVELVVPAGASTGRAIVVAAAAWARALSSARALSVAAVAAEPCFSFRSPMIFPGNKTNMIRCDRGLGNRRCV
mgnify:CR=1 FL=1